MKKKVGVDLGLTAAEKQFLRQVVLTEIAGHLNAPVPAHHHDPAAGEHLRELRGAFVTLYKDGSLRGCIGHIRATRPLEETVREMAIAAAFHDPRFPAVTAEELTSLKLEISVLTPLQLVNDFEEIEVGVHGLYLECQGHAGLLLPQVATEYGWSREEFLAHTCMKAGLSASCWRQSETRIYLFSADIF